MDGLDRTINEDELRKKIESIVEVLVEKKKINKDDVDAARVCLACLCVGANKEKVQALLQRKSLEPYWGNLQPYFDGEKVIVDDEYFFKNDIPFLLMVLTAKGFIKPCFGWRIEPKKVR